MKRLWLRVTVTPPRTAIQKQRAIRSSRLSLGERALLNRIDSRIHPYEDMYSGDGGHYFAVALSAIGCIDSAREAAGVERPRAILDMPCGFGRVTRSLVARFPDATVTVCDIRPRSVGFCARRFGADATISASRFEEVTFARSFDLIWCGSLITHLDAPRTLSLVDLFARSTRPGGLIVFTTHGAYVADAIRRGQRYKLAPAGTESLLSRYERDGFGYADYPGEDGYGVSLIAPAWVRQHVDGRRGLQQAYFRERGWDSHQDVFAFLRA